MNGPKAFATVLVIVIVVAILYPTINAAMPESWDEAPYTIELTEGSVGVSEIDETDMTFRISVPPLIFQSNLPEVIHDVDVEFLLGIDGCLISAGSFEIGDVDPKDRVEMTFTSAKIPVLYALSFAGNLQSGDDQLDFPFVVKTELKYLDWMDTRLLDVSMAVKATGTESDGTVSVNNIGDIATATVNVTSASGFVPKMIDTLYSTYGPVLIFSGDGFSVQAALTGKTMVVSLTGSDGNTCLDMMKKSVDETGKITYSHGLINPEEYTISGDAAKAVVNAMAGFYNKETSA